MVSRRWIYNSSLIAGLIFVALGVRLYFRNDIRGVIIHFVLAIILFAAALFTGSGKKGGGAEEDR
jgi:hypothetical protein